MGREHVNFPSNPIRLKSGSIQQSRAPFASDIRSRILAWVAFVVVICQISQALGHNSNNLVRNGVIVEPHEFNAVGQIRVLNPGTVGSVSIGTGTLLQPDLVITAAHVIDGALSPHHIKFSLDGNRMTASCIGYIVSPKYVRSASGGGVPNPGDDIALLKLDRSFPSDLDFPQLSSADCEIGEAGTIVGFGQDETQKLNIRMKGALKFHQKLRSHLLLFVPGTDANQMTDSGDSGGPMFVTRFGKREIAGVVHGGFTVQPEEFLDDQYDALDASLFVDIRRHATWIEKSIERLNRLQPTERPRYLYSDYADEPRMPFHSNQLLALLKASDGSVFPFDQLIRRGLSEPWNTTIRAELLSAGLSSDLISRIEENLESVATPKQLLALLRTGAEAQQIAQLIWDRGGIYGELDDETMEELRAAGASEELLKTLIQ